MWGARWFVPWICLPHVYNYHKAPPEDAALVIGVDEEELSNGTGSGTAGRNSPVDVSDDGGAVAGLSSSGRAVGGPVGVSSSSPTVVGAVSSTSSLTPPDDRNFNDEEHSSSSPSARFLRSLAHDENHQTSSTSQQNKDHVGINIPPDEEDEPTATDQQNQNSKSLRTKATSSRNPAKNMVSNILGRTGFLSSSSRTLSRYVELATSTGAGFAGGSSSSGSTMNPTSTANVLSQSSGSSLGQEQVGGATSTSSGSTRSRPTRPPAPPSSQPSSIPQSHAQQGSGILETPPPAPSRCRTQQDTRTDAPDIICSPTSPPTGGGSSTSSTSRLNPLSKQPPTAQTRRPRRQLQRYDCVICMSELDWREPVKPVCAPCNHWFHYHCLEQWMQVKMECPTCRNKLPPLEI
ncbi:unnamed protein product [Amoebophrya sp. A25]|nr:unnamed protein product [Amoebophrya sp. A25]|eukprot:GSA25T00003560001.1